MWVAVMTQAGPKPLLGLDARDLASLVAAAGEPGYRAEQLLEAVYRTRVPSIEEILTLPRQLRSRFLDDGYSIGTPKIEKRFVSKDGTVRYLIAFEDGQSVE